MFNLHMGDIEMNQKQEILKLIKLYKSYECLWNIHSKMFRRTDIKNTAYRQIALAMGSDEESIRRKLKNLRTSYTATRKKIMESKEESGTDEARESSLFYFTEMSFLDPCIVYRKVNKNSNITENSNTDFNEDMDQETQFEELNNWLEINNKPPPPKQQKISTNFDEAINKFISGVNSKRNKDEFELFGLSIASQLRKLPEIEAIQFMGATFQQRIDLRLSLMNSGRVTATTAGHSSCSPSASSSETFFTPILDEQSAFKTVKLDRSTTPTTERITSSPANFTASNFLNIARYKTEIDENSL